jgi:hypothetical protein
MTTTEASSEVDGEQQSTVQGSLDQPNEKPPLQFRDRIKDFRRVRAGDLIPNPRNWRIHPKSQADALCGLLAELGFADALLTRELPDGRLMLIDGHLRKENVPPDAQVPVLVLDVTEEEADKILLTLDPLATMAEADTERIKALLATVRTESEAVRELLKRTAGDRLWEILHPHEIKEVEVTLERADELRAKWGIGAGQVWQAGPHRMGCGDSTDQTFVTLLWGRRGPTCRLVWTDPPYGVDYASKNVTISRQACHKAFKKAIAREPALGVAEMRKLDTARCEEMFMNLQPSVRRGDARAVEVSVKVLNHNAKINNYRPYGRRPEIAVQTNVSASNRQKATPSFNTRPQCISTCSAPACRFWSTSACRYQSSGVGPSRQRPRQRNS